MLNGRKKSLSLYETLKHHSKGANIYIVTYSFLLSIAFLIATLAAVIITNEENLFAKLWLIMTSPAKLVTDYFALGGLAATLLNCAVCSLFSSIIMFFSRAKTTATTLAGYMLVIAHCFYGLNLLNMLPTILGVLIFCLVTKRKFSENVHIAFFSTALGPFISEILFRYTKDAFKLGTVSVTVHGILLALLFGALSGFIVPAIIPETAKMHRGYNMYKAGLALGLLGIFAYAFMYATFGLEEAANTPILNPEYYAMPYGYLGFMNIFFVIIFSLTILFGYIGNNFSFCGYSALIKSTGYGVDFLDKFGMPVCLINIGVYGLFIIGYLNIVFFLPEIFPMLPSGVGFTGATAGIVFAALTFAADGQQPRTVFPIVLGYLLLFLLVVIFSLLLGRDIPWTLSNQEYLNGLAFSTGLCTFSGMYGKRVGIIAGFLCAVICSSTASMHGGLVLYNGGFTSGLVALVLLPILDFYKVKPKHENDK